MKTSFAQQEFISMAEEKETEPLIHTRNPFKCCLFSKKYIFNLYTRRWIAELIGTLLYMFVGATSVSNFIGNSNPHLPTVALTYGFCYAGLSGAMLHVSGGHLNPAVTLGVFIAGGINWLAMLLYWSAQVIGALLGSLCVYVCELGISFPTSEETNNTSSSILYNASTRLMTGTNPAIGIFIEMLLTMLFVSVYIHTSMEKSELKSTSPALSGLTLAACILTRLTGGSLNPARSLGPTIVCNTGELWAYHYIYWIGPLIGGLLAGTIHRLILSSKSVLNVQCITTTSTNRPSYQSIINE